MILKVKRLSALHLLLLSTTVLSAVGIWWGLPSYVGWAPDELIPDRILKGMDQFFSNGWNDKYPPFHHYLLSLIQLPFWILQRLHVLDISNITVYTILFFLTRLLSVAMGTALIYLIYRTGREIYDRRASLFAGLITSLTIPFVYYSKTANVDIPYLFWLVWSLYFFIRIAKTKQMKYYLLFALTAALAVCTKDQAYAFYVAAPFLLVWADWREKERTQSSRSLLRLIGSKKNLLSAALAAGLFLLIHNVIFNLSGFIRHFYGILGPRRRVYELYPGSLMGRVRLLGETIGQIQECFGWPLFLVCAGGLIWFLVQKKKKPLLLPLLAFALSYYVFSIHLLLFNFARFNMPICIILSFFGGYFLSDTLAARKPILGAVKAAVILIFLYSFLYALSVDIVMLKDSRYVAERWIKANIQPHALIGVASYIQYSPRLRGFLWKEIPRSLSEFNSAPKPDYVIVDKDYARRFKNGTEPFLFFSGFDRQGERYQLVFDYKTPLPWLLLNDHFIMSQINVINPEIQIYKKVKE